MRRLANICMGVGVGIGVLGSIALALGFRPSQLPPALLDLSVYKLIFIGSACALAIGAMIRRADNRRRQREPSALSPPEAPAALASGARLEEFANRRSQRERERS